MHDQKKSGVFLFCMLFFLNACKSDNVDRTEKSIPPENRPMVGDDFVNSSGFCGGAGSAEDPFLICNAEQLARIDGDKQLANGDWDTSMRGLSFKLKKDIDLAGVTPLAQAGINKGLIISFSGYLDGSNFKIRNWGSASQSAPGALIIMNTGHIHNVIFENFHIKAQSPTGAFVGLNYSGGRLERLVIRRGSISNLSKDYQPAGVATGQNFQGQLSRIMVEDVSMFLLAGDKYSGGGAGLLTGFNQEGTVQDCEIHTSSIQVSDPSTKWVVGGAVGINQTEGVIKSVWATATIISAGPFDNIVGLNLGDQVIP